MHYYRKLSLLLVAVAVGLVSIPASAQTTGNCEEPISEQFLDINRVRAKIMNNGNLFWNGGANVYEIPQGSGNNSIFASGIWMGGQVNGQLRLAGSTYGPFEFWAGPLNDDGTPPADCEPFDRIYRISKEAIANYEESGTATPDLADWPTGLGAPTLRPAADDDVDNDGDGEVDENGEMAPIDLVDQPLASRLDRTINLAAGERPAILGDQMTWTIFNDRGNIHERTDTPPMGVEVHFSAFAFDAPGTIGNTTFYSYRIFYKGSSPLTDTYMGIFSDPDLGAAFDDYVGSDTTLGLGYVYNADNDDDGNYGEAPPAAGYDFFQGPLVNDNGIDDDGDGDVDEDDERLSMTAFAFYTNGSGVTGDPGNGADMYNYMRGRWKDGQPFTFGGNARETGEPTSFMFPGDPSRGEYWSEINSDGQGTPIDPADRRFVMASGPFTIQPGVEQNIVFGLVTSFGDDNLDSVAQLKIDDEVAQAAFDVDFFIPDRPARPNVEVTELDRAVTVTWDYSTNSNNYLDSYRVNDPFAVGDYVFEGYNLYRFASAADQTGEIVATYDVVNGITEIIEQVPGGDLLQVTAEGRDSGVAHSHSFDGLTNYTSYEFGVQAYAVNLENPDQKVYAGSIERVTAIPSVNDAVLSEDALSLSTSREAIQASRGDGNVGDGAVEATVVNPVAVTGDEYVLEFATVDDELTYSITNTTTGDVELDGAQVVQVTGDGSPEGTDVVLVDGLSYSVFGAPDAFKEFLVVANADGPLDPPENGSVAFNSNNFPLSAGTDRPTDRQQATNGGLWSLETGAGPDDVSRRTYDGFVSRAIRNGFGDIVPFDFEVRFTEECYNAWRASIEAGEVHDVNPTRDGCYGYDRFGFVAGFEGYGLQKIPFEVWRTGIATPDDPSDDVRLVPAVIDWGGDGWYIDIGFDHPASGGSNDPQTDYTYWYYPADMTPGEAGHDAWLDEAISSCYEAANLDDCHADGHGSEEPFSRIVFMNWNGGDVSEPPSTYTSDMPEPGTIFQINSTKPNQPGDSFTISTDGLGSREKDEAEQRAAIDEIGIVPNPYKGASAYEVSQLTDEVRFTNMPNQATIRVFTLNGTLITTLEKNSPGNSFAWNLTTEEGLPVASGMYLIHVDTDLGEKVLKFGVIKKRIQLNTF